MVFPRASSGGGIDSPATRQPVWVFAGVGRGFRTPPPLLRRWLRGDTHVFFFITLLVCAPALKRRGDVAPSRRPGGVAPVPLPPVRLHSAAGPHLPAAPRPLPSVGPYGLRAERLRATPALFFRLHAVLHGNVASVTRSLDAWWVWARVAVTSPTKRLRGAWSIAGCAVW